jgi:lipopolysaccharide/colanic/teichoic acid biosynthesis glycosyltransferase
LPIPELLDTRPDLYKLNVVVVSQSGTAPRGGKMGVLRRGSTRKGEAAMGKLHLDRSASRGALRPSWQLATKYVLDSLGAVLLLLVLLPALLLISCAVWLSMGCPVFFRQVRIGTNGRPFEILKFRTMAASAPAGDDGEDEDAKITRVGRFLRVTSLDELPQLVNVLRGEMSFVGPRPIPHKVLAHIPDYNRRHRMRTGITGWAQVRGAGRTLDRDTAEELLHRVDLDNYYIENWSLLLDAKILLLTFPALLRFPQNGKRLRESVQFDVQVAQPASAEASESAASI